jgi:Sporulation related domain.
VWVKGKPYFRVRCGPFKNRETAEKRKISLQAKEGLKGFVTSVDRYKREGYDNNKKGDN